MTVSGFKSDLLCCVIPNWLFAFVIKRLTLIGMVPETRVICGFVSTVTPSLRENEVRELTRGIADQLAVV